MPKAKTMSDQKFEKILKRIYTITLGREINQGLFMKLNEEQTSWVIQAAANVIIADGEIDSGEFDYSLRVSSRQWIVVVYGFFVAPTNKNHQIIRSNSSDAFKQFHER